MAKPTVAKNQIIPGPKFCRFCGAGLKSGAKFCANCGKTVVISSGNKPIRLLLPFIGLLVSLVGFLFASLFAQRYEAVQVVQIFLGLTAFMSGWVLISHLIKRLSRGSRVVKFLLWAVTLTLAIGFLVWVIMVYQSNSIAQQKDLLEVYVANVESSKILAKTGKPDAAKDQLANTAKELEELEVDSRLADYKLAVKEWAINSVADLPRAFTFTIGYSDAQAWLSQTIAEIAELKVYGDAAVARKDKDAMRGVTGRLAAVSHLLDNLDNQDYAAKPGVVYAAKRTVCTAGTPTICVADVKSSVSSGLKSGREYAAGTVSDSASWQATWQPIVSNLKGTPVPGVVESSQSGVPGPVPPAVNAFWADCNRLKGTDLGSSRKERLPTTESGYTCNYSQGGLKCWKLRTYSGRSFSGGAKGCPEQGLLPPPPSQSSKKTFDGTYTITSTGGKCNAGGFSASALEPISSSFQVKNGQIINPNGSNLVIGANGTATQNLNYNQAGVNLQGTSVVTFTSGKTFSGTWTIYGSSGEVSVSCNGTFTGQKQ